jgi:hypothetical protein
LHTFDLTLPLTTFSLPLPPPKGEEGDRASSEFLTKKKEKKEKKRKKRKKRKKNKKKKKTSILFIKS